MRFHFWSDLVAETRRWREEGETTAMVLGVDPRYPADDRVAVVGYLLGESAAVLPTEDVALPSRLATVVGERREVLRFLPNPDLTFGARTDPKGALDALLGIAGEIFETPESSARSVARYRLTRPLPSGD